VKFLGSSCRSERSSGHAASARAEAAWSASHETERGSAYELEPCFARQSVRSNTPTKLSPFNPGT
jgi:hypothetical protein